MVHKCLLQSIIAWIPFAQYNMSKLAPHHQGNLNMAVYFCINTSPHKALIFSLTCAHLFFSFITVSDLSAESSSDVTVISGAWRSGVIVLCWQRAAGSPYENMTARSSTARLIIFHSLFPSIWSQTLLKEPQPPPSHSTPFPGAVCAAADQ